MYQLPKFVLVLLRTAVEKASAGAKKNISDPMMDNLITEHTGGLESASGETTNAEAEKVEKLLILEKVDMPNFEDI